MVPPLLFGDQGMIRRRMERSQLHVGARDAQRNPSVESCNLLNVDGKSMESDAPETILTGQHGGGAGAEGGRVTDEGGRVTDRTTGATSGHEQARTGRLPFGMLYQTLNLSLLPPLRAPHSTSLPPVPLGLAVLDRMVNAYTYAPPRLASTPMSPSQFGVAHAWDAASNEDVPEGVRNADLIELTDDGYRRATTSIIPAPAAPPGWPDERPRRCTAAATKRHSRTRGSRLPPSHSWTTPLVVLTSVSPRPAPAPASPAEDDQIGSATPGTTDGRLAVLRLPVKCAALFALRGSMCAPPCHTTAIPLGVDIPSGWARAWYVSRRMGSGAVACAADAAAGVGAWLRAVAGAARQCGGDGCASTGSLEGWCSAHAGAMCCRRGVRRMRRQSGVARHRRRELRGAAGRGGAGRDGCGVHVCVRRGRRASERGSRRVRHRSRAQRAEETGTGDVAARGQCKRGARRMRGAAVGSTGEGAGAAV
ncbi:hypothetical protein GGX14DRAFT_408618 [Mycena pura]|uniref:Uncharacterized protein n=1 Tax=Mycena pura TaxID=153505 RepID=A0AAD6Y156_9AGAR|nr:hypothetical protein GGX14DRAFT_408618 [Mycena pura]